MPNWRMSRSFRGIGFRPKNVSKEIWFTGLKFHCSITSGSGVIENFRSGGSTLEGLRSVKGCKPIIKSGLVNRLAWTLVKRADLDNI